MTEKKRRFSTAGSNEEITQQPFQTFSLSILRVCSSNHSICPVSSPMSLRLSRAPVRVECTHARSTTMKDCRAAAGQPSWLTSARAPNTQPRNADFLVAIVPYLFTPFPDSLPRLYPPPSWSLFFSLFFFPLSSPSYASSTVVVCRRFAFRLRNEAKHPTLDM